MNNRTVFDETNLIWSGAKGAPLPEYDPKQSLGSTLLNALAKCPDKIGQISDNNGIRMTNGEIRWRSIRVAQNLAKLGIGFDDVILIIAKNHHYLAPIMFGALTIGAPVNALDVQFAKDEIVRMLQLMQPKLILCDVSVLGTMNAALKENGMDRPVFVFDGSGDGFENVEVLLNETDVSSALPDRRGFPRTLSSDDVMITLSSLYWLSGWSTLLMTTLTSATRIITTKLFTSELWLDIVQRHKVTVALSPPYSLALLVNDPKLNSADLSSLKLFLCTGGMVTHDVCDRMNKRLPNGVVIVVYAMTETAGFITANISALRPGSVGQLFPGFDMKIIDDKGDKCGIGQDGEIQLRPTYGFIRYYGDEESTVNTMDSDGWIRTGDVGHFDGEGFLYVTDRKKEILKYFNSQVSPTELEGVLMQLPGVANVCVVGIPDKVAGDLPAAVVIKSAIIDVSEDEINSLMKATFADAKQFRGGIYFVDELPLTLSGKILHRKVQEIARKYYKERQAEQSETKCLFSRSSRIAEFVDEWQ